jgi:hypothetical protein
MRDQDKLEISSIVDGNFTQTFPGYNYPAVATIKAALETFADDVAGCSSFPITSAEIEHSTAVLDSIIQSARTGNIVSVT